MLWTEPVGLVVADRLPIPKPAAKQTKNKRSIHSTRVLFNMHGYHFHVSTTVKMVELA